MTIVPSKYRGAPLYHRVFHELVLAAQYRGLTTYQDIAVLMGLPLQGSHMGKQVGHILGEIVEDEIEAGRPMLSAVCVSVEGAPGPGFYSLAKELELFDSDDRDARLTFWGKQREAVYEAWRRPLPKT